MIETRIRIEPRSDTPSPLQTALDACTVGWNAAQFLSSLATPYRLMEMGYRWNRTLARAWGLSA